MITNTSGLIVKEISLEKLPRLDVYTFNLDDLTGSNYVFNLFTDQFQDAQRISKVKEEE